jgi:hypothetical protein
MLYSIEHSACRASPQSLPRLKSRVSLRISYETAAFHAAEGSDPYWNADIRRPVRFDTPWAIEQPNWDDTANDMHEAAVEEITEHLSCGWQG